MIDPNRRSVLANGAAAAAASAVPQVFAQAQSAPVPGLPDGAKVGFYEKGNVRIRYADIGSGFPLLATPGGGLNSCMAVWARAVINIPQEFRNDFRIITMDQRNATGGLVGNEVADMVVLDAEAARRELHEVVRQRVRARLDELDHDVARPAETDEHQAGCHQRRDRHAGDRVR